MIPKIIHFFWFGKKSIPEKDLKNIDSWKKYCPDYEIKMWTEDNYEFPDVDYVKQAVEAKKWGHVSDYARLDVLYRYGGIYFDTDVELLRPIDDLLIYNGFAGFEDGKNVNTGQGIGSIPGSSIIKGMMDDYKNISFINDDGSLNTTPCPVINTRYLLLHGLIQNDQRQKIGELEIFPTDFFCPKSVLTGEILVTPNTYSIHHFNGSWHSEAEKKKIYMIQIVRRIFGIRFGNFVAETIVKLGLLKKKIKFRRIK